MSKRMTYLLGGAAIAVGVALIVIAFTSLSGDDGGGGGGESSATRPAERPSAPERPSTPPAQERRKAPGTAARGKQLSKAVAERRPVRAPGFAVEVVDDGSVPSQAGSLQNAVAGGSFALAALRGSPVVLHMWSSRCGPCRADARLVESTWRRWGRRGVAFVGLSVGDSEGAVRRFAREYDLSYPVARDAGGRVADAYGVTTLSQTFFISGGGNVIGQITGSPSASQMEQGTAAVRADRAFGSQQGGSRVPRR